MGARLMAIVAEGARSRVYLSPTPEHEAIAHGVHAEWKPDVAFYQQALGFRVGNYGMTLWSDLFTPRQLAMLSIFSGLVDEAREQIERDAVVAGMLDNETPLCRGGSGATAYAEAVSVYLGIRREQAGRSREQPLQMGAYCAVSTAVIRTAGDPDGLGLRRGQSYWQ